MKLFVITYIILRKPLPLRKHDGRYITPREASIKWGISKRCIQKLCEENRIDRVVRFGKVWAIPKEAEKPKDVRKKSLPKEK